MVRKTPILVIGLALILAPAIACGVQSIHQTDGTWEADSSPAFNYELQDTESLVRPTATVAPQERFGPRSVADYLALGLAQNPEIHEARLTLDLLTHRIAQAKSLPDPMLSMSTFVAPVQTAAGEQDFALGLNQKFPWRGKRDTLAAIAQQDVKAANARLVAVKLKVAEQIKNAYFQLHFVQQAIAIIERDQEQLELIENVVDQMFRVKKDVSQQDVLQIQVAASQLESELVNYQQQKLSAQARLARLMHVSPATKPEAQDSLPPEQIVQDIDILYQRAVESRPELQAQLAIIEKNRRTACLAELEHHPDLTLGFNWIATSNEGISPVANGDDAFLLTVGMNLPIYKRRINAQVREAQTRVLAGSMKYERLKDEMLEGVADLFAKITSRRENLRLFRDDILPKQKLTLDQSIEDYQVGKVDFLQMIENWRKLLRYQIAEKRLESELQQTLAALARQIGSF